MLNLNDILLIILKLFQHKVGLTCMIHLKIRLVYLTSYFMKKFSRNIIVRTNKNDSSNPERKRQKKQSANINFFYNTFQCILNSNIDKNFTKHNNSKFGDFSHDITFRPIWTTRSPPYRSQLFSRQGQTISYT